MKKHFLLLLLAASLFYCGYRYYGSDLYPVLQLISHVSSSVSETVSETIFEVMDDDSGTETEFPEVILGDTYKYYYGTLSDDEKEIYREIYSMIDQQLDSVTLSTTDPELAGIIQNYVLLDNPEFYYISSFSYTTTAIGDEVIKLEYEPGTLMSEDQIETAAMKIEAFDNDFTLYLKDHTCESSWDKAVTAYEYLLGYVEYNENAPYNQTLYSAACGETVCQGYAMAYKHLCNTLEIPCLIVTGTSETGDSHAWNAICVDDCWCYVDCTYGDTQCLSSPVDYSWFGISDDQMFARTLDQEALLPDCSSNKNNWYYRHNEYKTEYHYSDYADLASRNNNFSIQYSNRTAYDDAVQDLFEDEHLKSLSGNRSCHFYYIEGSDSLCIHLQLSYD